MCLESDFLQWEPTSVTRQGHLGGEASDRKSMRGNVRTGSVWRGYFCHSCVRNPTLVIGTPTWLRNAEKNKTKNACPDPDPSVVSSSVPPGWFYVAFEVPWCEALSLEKCFVPKCHYISVVFLFLSVFDFSYSVCFHFLGCVWYPPEWHVSSWRAAKIRKKMNRDAKERSCLNTCQSKARTRMFLPENAVASLSQVSNSEMIHVWLHLYYVPYTLQGTWQAFGNGFWSLFKFLRKFFTRMDGLGGLAHLVTRQKDTAFQKYPLLL